MFSLHFTSLCPATVARGVISSPSSSKSRGQSLERLASSCTCKDLLPLSSSELDGADPEQSIDLYQEMSTIMMFSHWICFHDNRHYSSNLCNCIVPLTSICLELNATGSQALPFFSSTSTEWSFYIHHGWWCFLFSLVQSADQLLRFCSSVQYSCTLLSVSLENDWFSLQGL